jgi:hypothetical protein
VYNKTKTKKDGNAKEKSLDSKNKEPTGSDITYEFLAYCKNRPGTHRITKNQTYLFTVVWVKLIQSQKSGRARQN